MASVKVPWSKPFWQGAFWHPRYSMGEASFSLETEKALPVRLTPNTAEMRRRYHLGQLNSLRRLMTPIILRRIRNARTNR